MSIQTLFTVSLPEWMAREQEDFPERLETVTDRMRFVLNLAMKNVKNQTGGPFAAAIFETETGILVSVGVNRVVPGNCSAAHAEIVAISLAQQQLGTYDLGSPGFPSYQLVVNWRPCAMCFGAIPWSGISQLVISGSDATLEQITGFDEGPIHPQWRHELENRGISVIDNVLRDEAVSVFEAYAESGNPVYNGSRKTN